MKYSKAIASLAFTIALCYALNRGWGTAPAFGRFLSPFTGFWVNAEKPLSDKPVEGSLQLAGLQDEVTIEYDELGIPHIFANNDHDLYLAQGYVTAKDRLWQMEFQTHYAAGRLTEIVGEKALESDKYNRRMGAVYGAEKSLAGMMEDPQSKVALEAYSEGVNAYIDQLKVRTLPVEYKLLGYQPERWTPIKSALFLKNMSFVLASGTDDLRMTNILRKYGREVAEELFPNYPFEESPIIPTGTPQDFTPLPLPKAPADFVGTGSMKASTERDKGIGSNNWAVSGSKSASGLPLLANDPHLTLSLPSIWYQMQLVGPNVNVYGATMPGTPNVISGFNKDIAWGVTNVGADIVDWYEVKFKDAKMNEYWHDGQWKKITKRPERYIMKNGEVVLDTVLFTHHGPIVYLDNEKPFKKNIPTGHALRWIAHDKSQELTTFYQLNRAKNYDDYVKALSFYAAPAQNFVFASNQDDIALWVNGKFPLKAKLQGKYILDGTDKMADWQGFIPHAHNPHVKNPARGFVSSANQSSTDPSYPYYINWEFAASERGRRINQRLEGMSKITVDSLRALQNDNYNLKAAGILGKLISLVKAPTAKQAKAIKVLQTWNKQNDVAEIAPTIFETWSNLLYESIWQDEFAYDENIPMKYPSLDKTIQLIKQEPTAKWFDNVNTKNKVETLEELAGTSLTATLDSLTKWQKADMGYTWAWANYKSTDIKHLIPGLDAFSKMNVNIGGGTGIVNATTERTGPSWRMIIQLGKNNAVKGYGVIPGGQSGNPGSPHYDDMIETWRQGKLNELLFLQNKNEKSARIKKTIKLTK
ncbi:penicillin acylase family protein [Arcicella lustrica]|uniref:Penicillin acylase family protein n=1 Tax=Arcicella lustrica TaxID=2984196 RepID=A0ABU5SIP8_9BACT|nr:penicillin acylase family protein [Arcicella sp. DC25W]MEA5427168.1 penicillin acylase family protein [Arcicella sp. DC25W]